MSEKRYVMQGVYLACDKGTTPTEFKITNNNNSFLFDEPVANTGDLAPSTNIMPFGGCSLQNGRPCMPVPTAWQGFDDGIFIGNFNPLLEDSIMPCGVGGKIEIFYSMADAEAACAEEGGGFWSTLGKVALVVGAVALIAVTGGMAIAAIGAVAAASGALATTVAVGVAVLEVAGVALTVKALYDYSQDGDEEALFKEVALGFLFLGAGKALEKGFRMWRASRHADEVIEIGDEVIEAGDDALKAGDEVIEAGDDIPEGVMTGRRPSSPEYPVKNSDGSLTDYGKWYYERPSGYRSGVRDEAWDAAKGGDGNVRDPLTDEIMSKDEAWDMGHKPGYEFRKHRQSAADRGIGRTQFLDEHNTSSHFRPELPSSNRSHAGEIMDDTYFGF